MYDELDIFTNLIDVFTNLNDKFVVSVEDTCVEDTYKYKFVNKITELAGITLIMSLESEYSIFEVSVFIFNIKATFTHKIESTVANYLFELVQSYLTEVSRIVGLIHETCQAISKLKSGNRVDIKVRLLYDDYFYDADGDGVFKITQPISFLNPSMIFMYIDFGYGSNKLTYNVAKCYVNFIDKIDGKQYYIRPGEIEQILSNHMHMI